ASALLYPSADSFSLSGLYPRMRTGKRPAHAENEPRATNHEPREERWMKELRGRTALVTGASRGIGSAITRAYAAAGMRVAVHYHRQEAAARETLAQMEGGGHLLVQADVADPDAVRR